ncbi:EthD domain-containing protein [Variovorax sp. J31P179]|uniref:EthD domain-containing protein n=1 Tax=Variovorax sp. J31P179 TaxID=3053508 RepID=UPI0025776E3D|nr:EthD domain-containing protein [Variovorax sp. J31P179]MDM0085385.1 EthD domain-containing protein [Variovorax sp. J31P179]
MITKMMPTSPSGEAAKRCSLLRRRRDWTFERFANHWAGPHAAIALTMPGIARYTQNRVSEELWVRGERFDCDGIVELEFRDEQSMAEAGKGEAVRTLLPEDEERFLDGITLCRVQGGARQMWPGMTKAMLAGCLSKDRDFEALEAALVASGCVQWSIDYVSATFHRQRLAYEDDPPQVFANLWFEDGSNLSAAFSDGSKWGRMAGQVLRRGTVWRTDPLQIVG